MGMLQFEIYVDPRTGESEFDKIWEAREPRARTLTLTLTLTLILILILILTQIPNP